MREERTAEDRQSRDVDGERPSGSLALITITQNRRSPGPALSEARETIGWIASGIQKQPSLPEITWPPRHLGRHRCNFPLTHGLYEHVRT